MGLLWIPLVIGIQLFLLYALLGGPARVLAKFAGLQSLAGEADWGRMQIGLPLALVMAFPTLATLALMEKSGHAIGMIEVGLVQGLFLALLMAWLRRREHRRAHPEHGDTIAPPALVEPAPTPPPPQRKATSAPDKPPAAPLPPPLPDAPLPKISEPAEAPPEISEPAEEASQQPAPPPPPPEETPASPAETASPEPQAPVPEDDRGWRASQALIAKLRNHYMWDTIGLDSEFIEARQTPLKHLLADAAAGMADPEHLAAMRDVARAVMAKLSRGEAPWPVDADAEVLEPDAYERDVMRRLTCSAAYDYDRLFVDQNDVELCGSESLVALYRLALFEVRSHRADKAWLH